MDVRELERLIRGEVFTDRETLEQVRTDFGRILEGAPVVIVVPADERDVQTAVRFAFDHEWPLSVRGASHTQGGQSLNRGGILLDTSSLNHIGAVEKDRVWVQAGALWSDVVRHTLPEGLLPPVLVSHLEVTVGGTLSTGGYGASSHRFGAQVDHVLELEVVTGEGHRVRCSETENAELFRCVRAGLGQFGVITGAGLRLRKALPRVRTHYLLYDDLKVLMSDLQRWMQSRRVDYIECGCSPCGQGLRKVGDAALPFAEWFYPVQVGFEFRGSRDCAALPEGARPYRVLGHDDYSIEEFVRRFEPQLDLWRRAGSWRLAHPWLEVFLPWNKGAAFVLGVLRSFPCNLLDGGQVLLRPLSGRGATVPLLRLPAEEQVLGFALQPCVPQQSLPMVLPMIAKAAELSAQVGGKRYLTGWLDFDHDGWKSHFGELWPAFLEWKRFYDPKHLLNPGLIDVPEVEAG